MKLKETNPPIDQVIFAGININLREWCLRITKNNLRYILFFAFGIILSIISKWIALVFFSLIWIIIMVDFYTIFVQYKKMAIQNHLNHPTGNYLEFDEIGFQRSAESGYKWPMIKWDTISLGFHLKKHKIIALYHRGSKSYFIFFGSMFDETEFSAFKKTIEQRIKNIY